MLLQVGLAQEAGVVARAGAGAGVPTQEAVALVGHLAWRWWDLQ